MTDKDKVRALELVDEIRAKDAYASNCQIRRNMLNDPSGHEGQALGARRTAHTTQANNMYRELRKLIEEA